MRSADAHQQQKFPCGYLRRGQKINRHKNKKRRSKAHFKSVCDDTVLCTRYFPSRRLACWFPTAMQSFFCPNKKRTKCQPAPALHYSNDDNVTCRHLRLTNFVIHLWSSCGRTRQSILCSSNDRDTRLWSSLSRTLECAGKICLVIRADPHSVGRNAAYYRLLVQ